MVVGALGEGYVVQLKRMNLDATAVLGGAGVARALRQPRCPVRIGSKKSVSTTLISVRGARKGVSSCL